MGVNCCVYLANGATWQKVGQVACALLGAKMKSEPLGDHGGVHTIVEGFGYGKYKTCSMPEYLYIEVTGDPNNPVAKAIQHSDSLPYQMWYGLESRFLYPKATAAKIALADGIARFFGGKIEFNDATGDGASYPARKWLKNMDNDKNFGRYQQELLDIKPLTKADIKKFKEYAAY